MPQDILIERLNQLFAERVNRNPNYSLRAFARSLKINSGTLSTVLKKKRVAGPRLSVKLIQNLNISKHLKKQILLSVIDEKILDEGDRFRVIDTLDFEKICSWEYDAILCSLQIPDFQRSLKKISQRLNLSLEEIRRAMKRLERIGLVRKESGKWYLRFDKIACSREISPSVIQRVYRQYLAMANRSFDIPKTQRDFSGTTMAISKKKLPEAYKMIEDFRRKLCDFLEEGEKEDLYRLSVQLFPIQNETQP